MKPIQLAALAMVAVAITQQPAAAGQSVSRAVDSASGQLAAFVDGFFVFTEHLGEDDTQ